MPWLGQISLTRIHSSVSGAQTFQYLQRHKQIASGIDIPHLVKGLWRREGDLNSRGTGPRDFQSRALPGYAISAAISPTGISCLTETVENRLWQLRIDYITTVGGSDHATMA